MQRRKGERTLQVYNYIVSYMNRNNGRSPTVREIANACGFRSTAPVYRHVKKLAGLGAVHKRGKNLTGLTVAGAQWQPPTVGTMAHVGKLLTKRADKK